MGRVGGTGGAGRAKARRGRVKPLAFFDVDGVLNRYRLQSVPVLPGERWIRTTVEFPGFNEPVPLVLDDADTARIASVRDVVDPVWGTTWNEHANAILAPLIGLDPMPVAPMYRKFSEYDQTAQWKWRHVVAYAGNRPFVWIDDGITLPMLARAERRSRVVAPTLLITAHPAVGLTDAMMDWDVREFAEIAAGK